MNVSSAVYRRGSAMAALGCMKLRWGSRSFVKHTCRQAHIVCMFLFSVPSVLPSFRRPLPVPKVRLCDIITALPAGVVMWKWRRGKWVAGTSCWCLSGCTVVTMATLPVSFVAMVSLLLWCPTAAGSLAGKEKVKFCSLDWLFNVGESMCSESPTKWMSRHNWKILTCKSVDNLFKVTVYSLC